MCYLFLDALSDEELDLLVERGTEIFNTTVEESLSQTDPKLYEDLVKFLATGKGDISFGLLYADDSYFDEVLAEARAEFDEDVHKTLYIFEVEIGFNLESAEDRDSIILASMLLSADESVKHFHVDWIPYDDDQGRLPEMVKKAEQMVKDDQQQ